MNAAPVAPRRKRITWLQFAGWVGLGVLLVVSAAVSYAIAVLVGR